jgi:glycosyltransferase involved in cell wall biosynthesis
MIKMATEINSIDVAVPAFRSEPVLEETLDALKIAFDASDVKCNRLLIDYKPSEDQTELIAREWSEKSGWDLDLEVNNHDLPAARQNLINRVVTDWFLFLDDDVKINPTYLKRLFGAVAPEIGAVQGRKESSQIHPSRWVKNRANRGGTHATLIRHSTVSNIKFPENLSVLEDEYLRQHIESDGFLWTFHHHARFTHQNQSRHPMGWEEGYLAGYHKLKSPGEVIFLVPYEIAVGGSLAPRLKRAAGFVYGLMDRKLTKYMGEN